MRKIRKVFSRFFGFPILNLGGMRFHLLGMIRETCSTNIEKTEAKLAEWWRWSHSLWIFDGFLSFFKRWQSIFVIFGRTLWISKNDSNCPQISRSLWISYGYKLIRKKWPKNFSFFFLPFHIEFGKNKTYRSHILHCQPAQQIW